MFFYSYQIQIERKRVRGNQKRQSHNFEKKSQPRNDQSHEQLAHKFRPITPSMSVKNDSIYRNEVIEKMEDTGCLEGKKIMNIKIEGNTKFSF